MDAASHTATQPPLTLRVTPHGVVVPEPASDGDKRRNAILKHFAEHEAAGLIALAAEPLPHTAGPIATYWCDVAADLLRALCHLQEAPALSEDDIDDPGAARLAERVLSAPPMPGGEYISPSQLLTLWHRLRDWTTERVAAEGGIAGFLAEYAPRWQRVGRVSLHLAENKSDPEYPFAFMATYAAGVSRSGRIRRLPLSRALNEYAGAGQKRELLNLLSPLHAATRVSALIADLVESGDVFHPLAWSPAEAHAFLREIPLYEECGLIAELPNWWKKRARPRVAVTLDSRQKGTLGTDSMLEFDIGLALGDEVLTAEEVQALLNASDPLVQLRGEWVEVDREKLQQALEHWQQIEAAADSGVSFIEGMRLLAGASASLKPDEALESTQEWSSISAGRMLRDALAGLRSPGELSGPQPRALNGTLRHYQLDGLNWLWLCAHLGVGSCLADDMGLGKTIQILSLLLRSREQASKTVAAPALLVVPASLIGNWKAEAQRFAPDLELRVAHASESTKQEITAMAENPAQALVGVDLVITTYSMVPRLTWLTQHPWRWLILDEAQAIKNPSARQTRSIKKLTADRRIALTGTPVENRLGDLWSIFDFLNPGLLGSAARFKSFAKALEKREHARYAPLRNLVTPYILRRMKTDPTIVPDLPPKTEMQIYCGLSKPQVLLYRQNVKALKEGLEGGEGGIQRRGQVLSYLLRFKQICNHPSQFSGDGEYTPEASGKFGRLAELCGEIASRGEKLLLFTQFREMTEPLHEHLAHLFGRPGLILHGGTAVARRKQLVAQFQQEQGPPFFVLSIKAGGTGLNLTQACHVVHFDRWWNPAVENQATDRAFRIGQQRHVMVHKFVTRGTIEEKIDALILDKQKMANELLAGGGEKMLTEMSNDEIMSMVSLDIDRSELN